MAGGICARTRCVRASTPVGVATVNIWLCMSLAGAECTLTAALARRRINSATCSVNYDILSKRKQVRPAKGDLLFDCFAMLEKEELKRCNIIGLNQVANCYMKSLDNISSWFIFAYDLIEYLLEWYLIITISFTFNCIQNLCNWNFLRKR